MENEEKYFFDIVPKVDSSSFAALEALSEQIDKHWENITKKIKDLVDNMGLLVGMNESLSTSLSELSQQLGTVFSKNNAVATAVPSVNAAFTNLANNRDEDPNSKTYSGLTGIFRDPVFPKLLDANNRLIKQLQALGNTIHNTPRMPDVTKPQIPAFVVNSGAATLSQGMGHMPFHMARGGLQAMLTGKSIQSGLSSALAGLGGPVGAMLLALPQIARGVAQVGGAAPQAVARGFGAMSQVLHSFRRDLGPITLMFDAMRAPFQMIKNFFGHIPIIGDAINHIMNQWLILPGIFEQVTKDIVAMVRVALPGLTKVWDRTLLDLQGVVGLKFFPVLEAMIEGVRWFGDFMMAVLPTADQISQWLAPLKRQFSLLGQELIELFSSAEGRALIGLMNIAIQASIYYLRGMVFAIRQLTVATRAFLRVMAMSSPTGAMIYALMQAAAANNEFDFQPGASVGAASAPARIQSLEGFESDFQIAAFREPAISMEQNVANIAGNVQEIRTLFEIVWQRVQQEISQFAQGIGAGGGGGVGGATVNSINMAMELYEYFWGED